MSKGVAFIVMPFGLKPGPDGKNIDFNRVYEEYLKPAVEAAGLRPHRADAERRGGSIHADMFQDLLMAEMVVADLTVDNPNVWYEIGVRHALRASGAVLTYALRDRLPFDLNGQRMMRYTMIEGAPAPAKVEDERKSLTEAIVATMAAWKGRKASPVYMQLPNLREPDWKSLKVGDVNEFWQALEAWQGRIRVAQQRQRPGDILLLADETPNRSLELEALQTAAKALIEMNRPRYALETLEKALAIDPDDLVSLQRKGIALGRAERYEEAKDASAGACRQAPRRRDARPAGANVEGPVETTLGNPCVAQDRPARGRQDDGVDASPGGGGLCRGVSRQPRRLLPRHQRAYARADVGGCHRTKKQARSGSRRQGRALGRKLQAR